MSRVDPSDVKGGGFQTTLSEGEITERIEEANLIVSEELEDTDQSEDRLELIEKYVTRALIVFDNTRDRQASEQQVGNARKSFAGDLSGEFLNGTTPGQTAVGLDKSGKLADMAKPTATIDVPSVK